MKFSKLKVALLSIVLVSLVLSFGVFSQEQETLDFGVFIVSAENPFFPVLADGARAYATEHNIEVTMYDGRRKPSAQLSQIETALARGIDGIILNAIDVEALVPAVKKANEAGVPVVTVDRDVHGGERLAYIGTDNVNAGRLEASETIKALEAARNWSPAHSKKPWRIAILEGVPGSSAGMERKEGVHSVLDPLVEKGEVEIVADQPGYFTKPKGLEAMENILARTHDIDAVISTNDNMAMGVIKALEGADLEVGFPEGVITSGIDGQPFAYDAIKEGSLTTSIAQSPFAMGKWAAQAIAMNIREDWTPPADQPVYKPTGAVHYGSGEYVVNYSNVNERIPYQFFKQVPPLPGTE